VFEGASVGVVVPAFNEEGLVGDVLLTMPEFVDRVYVVDDASTDGTWEEIDRVSRQINRAGGPGVSESQLHQTEREPTDPESDWSQTVVALRHETNHGVGRAIKTGYRHALADGLDAVAVMAGDRQMPPELLHELVRPVARGDVGYAKANRLETPAPTREMPRFRYVGNTILSYLTKIASGYWEVSDPQNGYTVVSRKALQAIDLDELYEDYGYCNDLLIRLNVAGVRIAEVSQKPVYGEEESHINYSTYTTNVSTLLLRRFCWRLWQYRATDRTPIVVSYGIAAILFLIGSTLAVRSLFSENSWAETGRVGSVLTGSVLACLRAMYHDRAVNSGMVVSTRSSTNESGVEDEYAPHGREPSPTIDSNDTEDAAS